LFVIILEVVNPFPHFFSFDSLIWLLKSEFGKNTSFVICCVEMKTNIASAVIMKMFSYSKYHF